MACIAGAEATEILSTPDHEYMHIIIRTYNLPCMPQTHNTIARYHVPKILCLIISYYQFYGIGTQRINTEGMACSKVILIATS